jgi:hypothetical protein
VLVISVKKQSRDWLLHEKFPSRRINPINDNGINKVWLFVPQS